MHILYVLKQPVGMLHGILTFGQFYSIQLQGNSGKPGKGRKYHVTVAALIMFVQVTGSHVVAALASAAGSIADDVVAAEAAAAKASQVALFWRSYAVKHYMLAGARLMAAGCMAFQTISLLAILWPLWPFFSWYC